MGTWVFEFPLNHTIVVFGFESIAVHASSTKSPLLANFGRFKVTLFGGTENKKQKPDMIVLNNPVYESSSFVSIVIGGAEVSHFKTVIFFNDSSLSQGQVLKRG